MNYPKFEIPTRGNRQQYWSGASLRGEIQLPGDKSVSHRYAILAAMARGVSHISNYSSSQDCQSTLNCLLQLGARKERTDTGLYIEGPGWQHFRMPSAPLNAENSGTTIRLISALLAACPFASTIVGDASLNRRPMKRIMTPLTGMGTEIEARADRYPPLSLRGGSLRGIRYELPVPSAQVKSCVLLAGMMAQGTTTVIERIPSRDHTERAIPFFGAKIRKKGLEVSVSGPRSLTPTQTEIPGDFSAAAYFLVAALLAPGSDLYLKNVGVNPSRTALLQLLEESGLRLDKVNLRSRKNEPVCDLRIRHQESLYERFPAEILREWIPNLIDEIPILSILGTQLKNGFTIRHASELRKKESDRIHSIVSNLQALGLEIEEWKDGFHIPPGQTMQGGKVTTFGDHRIAMSFAIAGLITRKPIQLDDTDCVAVSFPDFFATLESVVT